MKSARSARGAAQGRMPAGLWNPWRVPGVSCGPRLPRPAPLILLCALAGAASQVRAQTAEGGVLTLHDALELAIAHNPQYRQALNRMELEGVRLREALGAFLPDLRLSYGTSQSFYQESTAFDFFGNPIANPEVRTIVNSNSSQSVNASLTLFQGGRRFHAYNQAHAQARVDRLSAENDLNRILAEVQRHFLVAQRQKARLAVEERLLAARERDFELAERRFELATVGRSDLLGATLELRSQRVTVTEARGQMLKSTLALRRAIGDPEPFTAEVEQQLPEPFDPATLDLEALVAEGLSASPAVAAAAAGRLVRQSMLSVARAQRWPTLSLSSGVNRSTRGPDQDALFNLNPDDFYGSVSLSVSIPLFSRFQTSQQIASARVELRNAGEQFRLTELELEQQVRSAFVDLETAWANVEQRTTAAEVAGERLRIVQEEYMLAAKSIEELRAAIREEAAAQRDLVDQRFEFAVALLGLYEAAGVVADRTGLDARGDPGSRQEN